MKRGDVVLVAFPYVSGGAGKNRPALIIQCDRNNQQTLLWRRASAAIS
jgi:mRNA-degrading endonuclease toxin of MazEF toxin-antitoxin module